MNCNHQLDDNQITIVSQFYPDLCAQIAPPAQEVKPRRRNRGEQSGISGTKNRKLSQEQITLLELNFGDENKLESQWKDRLAAELGHEPSQVSVWCKKLEEEYSRLKAGNEYVLMN